MGDKLRCGVALAPPVQPKVALAGPMVLLPPPGGIRGAAGGGLSDSLKTIGGGLQRNAEQRRQAVLGLILAGRCGEAEAYALKTGDADLTSHVQGACARNSP